MSLSTTKLKITKTNMNYKAKMDQTKIPAPVRKLIEAAKDDLMDRYCMKQYLADLAESSNIKK